MNQEQIEQYEIINILIELNWDIPDSIIHLPCSEHKRESL
jgi:hypothetical protein